ncbi:MAG: serine protease, partial [Alphaproteobacteria bacterium]
MNNRSALLAVIPTTTAFIAAVLFLCLFAPVTNAQTIGPASVADVAEKLQDAVVNISTTQKLKDSREVRVPKAPKGSPFEEFFQDFFDNQERGQRTNSLGSGFIIDPSGLIVTNNHVIESADEITAILTDGTLLKVTKIVGRDTK